MSSAEKVDHFAQMFDGEERPLGGDERRARRQARGGRERHGQLTQKQRKRRAVRTKTLSFRCSPEFIALVKGLGEHMDDRSIADVLEEAAELLAEAKGYKHG